jgi:hypothetical protein
MVVVRRECALTNIMWDRLGTIASEIALFGYLAGGMLND